MDMEKPFCIRHAIPVIIIALMLLMSCSEAPVHDFRVGYVTVTGESKRLDTEDNATITSIEYKATPLFEYEAEYRDRLVGATDGYESISFSGAVSDLVGPFSCGLWNFQIRALNSNGNLLYVAEETSYIAPGRANIIRFEIERTAGTGTIDFDITCPKISVSGAENLEVDVDGIRVTEFEKTISDSYIRFRGTVDVPSGTHHVSFFYADGGEAMSLNVTENDVIYVTGMITPAYYEIMQGTFIEPVRISGHVEGSTSCEPSANITLTFVTDEGVCTSEEVHWYINGTDSGKTGFKQNFSMAEEGNYVITAFVARNRSITIKDSENNDVVKEWTETASDQHLVKVQRLYTVTVDRAHVLTSGTPMKNGKAVTFPYTAKVTRIHEDGYYTPYELGFDT